MPGEMQRTARETVTREPRLDGSPQAARPSTADPFGRGPSPVARGPRTNDRTHLLGPRAARREIMLTPFDELLDSALRWGCLECELLRHVAALNSLLCPAMLGGGGIDLPNLLHPLHELRKRQGHWGMRNLMQKREFT